MTTNELKELIRENINEMLSGTEVEMLKKLDDLKSELSDCLKKIENHNDPIGECEQRVGEINKEVTDMLHDPSVSDDYKRVINSDNKLEGLLGKVDQLMKHGSSSVLKETWEEAISSGDLEEAVLTEKAPPGMEPWVKANKERFIKQYGQKKGLGVVYATAWKMFYKNKKSK